MLGMCCCIQNCVRVWAPQFKKDVKVPECIQGGQHSWWKGWKARPGRSSWGLWACLAWRRPRGDLIALPRILRRGRGEGGAELSSLVPRDRMRGNGSKLRPSGRFGLDMRKHFLTERVVGHWIRLPREVVDAPSLSLFKRHLGNALNNPLWLGQSQTGQAVGLDDRCRCLPTETA